MAFDNDVRDNDQVYSSHDVKVIVDDQTLSYLKSATIAYIQDNGRTGFRIEPHDPVAASACGGCSSEGSC
ncbi:MAG: hypothetical protein DRI56_05285 [Chloroflexota bacterium]|nr:MAG: hypothetical protein DRI56_05285 [Chloroflexota bacterium]